jgi:hypothetical protein
MTSSLRRARTWPKGSSISRRSLARLFKGESTGKLVPRSRPLSQPLRSNPRCANTEPYGSVCDGPSR